MEKKLQRKDKYQLQILNARTLLKKGLVIDAYDILGNIIEDINKNDALCESSEVKEK